MTPAQAKELLPIMTAYAEGKVVQSRIKADVKAGHTAWYDFVDNSLLFLAPHREWRIKPEPREWWICTSTGCRKWFAYDHVRCPDCCASPLVAVKEVFP